jgi:hypothetical protein
MGVAEGVAAERVCNRGLFRFVADGRLKGRHALTDDLASRGTRMSV